MSTQQTRLVEKLNELQMSNSLLLVPTNCCLARDAEANLNMELNSLALSQAAEAISLDAGLQNPFNFRFRSDGL